MQWRVKQPNGDREAFHGFIDSFEVTALHRQQLGQGSFTLFNGLGDDHFPDRRDPLALEEHVFSTAQSNPLGPKFAGLAGIGRGIGVGPNLHRAHFIGPGDDPSEVAANFCRHGADLLAVHRASGTVEADPVVVAEGVSTQGEAVTIGPERNLSKTRDTAGAHAAGDHGCV